MEKIRKHIIFGGFVQGVGFRYRAYHAASANGVTGWVKNLYDGRVEAELEGTEEAIDMTIMQIENGHYIQIDSIEARNIPVKGDRSFEVRY